MSSDWRVVKVRDICSKERAALATGPFGSAISSKFFQNAGIPVIRGGNLSQDIGVKLDHRNLVYVSHEKAKEFSRSIARRGDLIFTCWGTVDQVGLIDQDSAYQEYVISNKQMKMTPNEEIADSRFLYYEFSGPRIRDWIASNAIGSSVPGFNLGQLREIEIDLPPLPEQKAIAHILGSLDDKIELNRKTNETLEAMAKALFKSWFVDFDPGRAKAEGRSTGLPAEISDLFPDSFEESELGKIPRGSKVISAGSVYDISIGKTPPRNESQWFTTNPNDIRWISIRDLGVSGTYISNTSEYLTQEAVGKFNIRVVPDNTVVVSFKLTVGRVGITDGEMLSNEAIAHFIPKSKVLPTSYTYFLLKHYDYNSLGSTSSIATAVNSQSLREMPIIETPSYVAIAFDETTKPFMSRIRETQRNIFCLEQLRDTLLPKLISGELRVPDAEALVAEAGL